MQVRASGGTDARGCSVSGGGGRALEHYERALHGFLAWTGDPRAEAACAVDQSPDFVMGHVLGAHLRLCSRDPAGLADARDALGRAVVLPANERERMHLAAIAVALQGNFAGARDRLAAILARHPRDLLALAVTHTIDYYLGDVRGLRGHVAAALPAWSAADRGYHGVLAMRAFGLVESGDYGRADEAALAALALEPGDIRAHHARCHVLEMQGRAAEGLRWMGERARYWTGEGAASTHIWWHLALYHLQLGGARHALELLDRRIAADAAPALSELIDASALLWRLALQGIEPGVRWQRLAALWAPHAEEAYCAFNDVHAMLAFVGARRRDLAQRLLAAQRERIALGGTNQVMLRSVGRPACLALAAYGDEDYARAARLLRGLPAVSHRLGGSQAQRSLIDLTLREAALRSRASRAGPVIPGLWRPRYA